MTDHPETHDPDNHQQLEKIEIQRRTLEQLFKISRSVENLRVGLETTLLLGKPAGHTSEKAVALYQKLDAKTHDLSNHEIHMRLQRIDQKIKQHLKETIHLVEHLDDPEFATSIGDALEITHNRVHDFRRTAQTMTALRVLLNLRGLPVAPQTFTVSQKVLLEKIQATKSRERQYRKQLTDQTLALEQEIQQLLKNHSGSKAMQPLLEGILKGLKANRRHIAQGLNIHELPYEIDQIVITDTAAEVHFEDPPSSSPKTTTAAPLTPENNIEEPPVEAHRKGVWTRFKTWVNTPFDLSTDD